MDITTLSAAKAYTDKQRIAYTEEGKVIFEANLTKAEGEPISGYTGEGKIYLEEGKVYEVTLDSGTHSAKCNALIANGMNVLVLGNASIVGGEDTGESFTVASRIDDGRIIFVAADFSGGTSVTIKTAEIVHKIDEKYLPSGGGLPVVHITSLTMTDIVGLGNNSSIAISDSDAAALADASGDVIVITFDVAADTAAPVPLLFSRMEFGGVLSFVGQWLLSYLIITNGEGSFVLMKTGSQ